MASNMMSSDGCDYERKRREWKRGQTPTDIQIICLNICRKYLRGIWTQINENQIIVERITGGFTNQLYFCGLTCDCKTTSKEPKEVVIRLYGKKWINNNEAIERLNDVIIGCFTSQCNLGAKQIGFFKGGNIEEYVKSHPFGLREQSDDKYVDRLSTMLARFHCMDVPIPRDEDWYSNFLDDFYTKSYQTFPIDEMLREVNANTLLAIDLKKEIQWLKKCLSDTKSPIVFSHNDFRGSNIMVREFDQSIDESKLITFCDFEYSCYAYRGFDFGALFEDWGRTDSELVSGDVSDLVIEKFMTSYLNECIKIKGKVFENDCNNCVTQLVREAKVFSMAQQMFFLMFILRTEEIPYNKTKQQILQRGDQRMKQYLKIKEKCLKDGLISHQI